MFSNSLLAFRVDILVGNICMYMFGNNNKRKFLIKYTANDTIFYVFLGER